MSSLAIPAKNIRALEALVRECGFGWAPPIRGKLRDSRVPSRAEWLDARLKASPHRACCERTTGKWFLTGEYD